jgi:hypothetical protein
VFGYKNHISIDRRHGFIRRWNVTDAAAHAGAMLRAGLLDRSNTGLDGLGRQRLSLEGERGLHGNARLQEPGPPPQAEGACDGAAHPPRQRHPLGCSPAVEPVFAHMKGAMALSTRTVGIARAKAKTASPTSPTTSGVSSCTSGEPASPEPAHRADLTHSNRPGRVPFVSPETRSQALFAPIPALRSPFFEAFKCRAMRMNQSAREPRYRQSRGALLSIVRHVTLRDP